VTHRPSNQATWLTPRFYAEKGRPLLAATSASAIAPQISVLRLYAGRIRARATDRIRGTGGHLQRWLVYQNKNSYTSVVPRRVQLALNFNLEEIAEHPP